MRVQGMLSLMLWTAAIGGCGHADVPANAAAPNGPDSRSPAAPAPAAGTGGAWSAPRWYALFERIPAPSEKLAQAGGLVGVGSCDYTPPKTR